MVDSWALFGVTLFVCDISRLGEFSKSNSIPSTNLGMISVQKSTAVNFVVGGSAVITGKPSRDHTIETKTLEWIVSSLAEIVVSVPQQATIVHNLWHERTTVHHRLRSTANPGADSVECS
jgi:antitoxin component of MazEF toxin-antitoxin module